MWPTKRRSLNNSSSGGIRANVVALGPVWTVLQPSGGQPVELAPVFVLLASSEASFIYGEVFGVTCGKGVA